MTASRYHCGSSMRPDRPRAGAAAAWRDGSVDPCMRDALQGHNTWMPRPPIYLDCHATTPVDDRVLEAMLRFFTRDFGNAASSTHPWGWRARDAVEQSRRDVAAIIGASAREIVFTSGATESNNLAIRGAAMSSARRHLVVSAIEHK